MRILSTTNERRGMATSSTDRKFRDYEGFVDKFKQCVTTDDCFTPPEVYEAVAGYVSERFGVARSDMVRPFYPGGDFEGFDYPPGCCVVDNPPFSILMRIKRFYVGRGIRFFLFAPSLMCFSGDLTTSLTHILTDTNITYDNGAVVRTGFVTNMGGDVVAEACPELHNRLKPVCDVLARRKKLPKYEYPDEVLTSSKLQWMAGHGTSFQVRRADCERITRLESQGDKGIFGGGLLLSERAAAERAAANRWTLSERERARVRELGR